MTKPVLTGVGLGLLGWSFYNGYQAVGKVTQVVQRVGVWAPAVGGMVCLALAFRPKAEEKEPEPPKPPDAIMRVGRVSFDTDTEEMKYGLAFLDNGVGEENMLAAFKHAHQKLEAWRKEGRRIGFEAKNDDESAIAAILVYDRMQSSSLPEAVVSVYNERKQTPGLAYLPVLYREAKKPINWEPLMASEIDQVFKDACRQLKADAVTDL